MGRAPLIVSRVSGGNRLPRDPLAEQPHERSGTLFSQYVNADGILAFPHPPLHLEPPGGKKQAVDDAEGPQHYQQRPRYGKPGVKDHSDADNAQAGQGLPAPDLPAHPEGLDGVERNLVHHGVVPMIAGDRFVGGQGGPQADQPAVRKEQADRLLFGLLHDRLHHPRVAEDHVVRLDDRLALGQEPFHRCLIQVHGSFREGGLELSLPDVPGGVLLTQLPDLFSQRLRISLRTGTHQA